MPSNFATFVPATSLALVMFVSTNVDGLFVLLGFFADPKYRARSIAIGQYLGISAIFLGSVLAALIALAIPGPYVGLMGIGPIVIGGVKLFDLVKDALGSSVDDDAHPVAGVAQALSVALVTISNGGDNIGVYIPVFAGRTASEIGLIAIVFATMTAVWLCLAHWLVNHRALGAPMRRWGGWAVPFVLIFLGFYTMHEAGSFELISGLVRSVL